MLRVARVKKALEKVAECEEKRSGEDGVCVEKAHVAVAVSGKPHEIRVAERQSTSVCGVLGEVREVHVIETHVLERREARARSGRAVVDALQGTTPIRSIDQVLQRRFIQVMT